MVNKQSVFNKKNPNSKEAKRRRTILFGSFLILISVILFLSFTSYLISWESDQSILYSLEKRDVLPENIISKLGVILGHFFLYQLFGISSYIIVYMLFITGSILFFNISGKNLIVKWSWGLSYLIFGSLLLSFFHSNSPLYDGIVGYEASIFIMDYIGTTGFVSLLIFIFLCFLVLHWKLTPENIISFVRKKQT